MTRGPVHLGDLLTAATVLRVDSPEGLRVLAGVLGLPLHGRPAGVRAPGETPVRRSPEPAAAAAVPPGATPPTDVSRTTPPLRSPAPQPLRPGAEGPLRVPVAPGLTGPAEGTAASATGSLTTLHGPDPGRGPRPPATSAALPLLEQGPPAARRSPAPWDPRTQRGIMLAAASTDAESREVDDRRLVDLAVRSLAGRAPRRVLHAPRRIRPTTREGALLLLDRSTGMQPFRQDRVWLAELAGSVLRRDRVEVRELLLRRGVSSDGGRTWVPYRPPAPGRPVVLLSDLGALAVPFADRTATTPAEWLAWLRRVRRAGNPVACLTPFPPEVYPAAVRRAVALVALDRRTSIGSVRTETRRFRDRGPRR